MRHRLVVILLPAITLVAAFRLVTAPHYLETETFLATAYSMGGRTRSGDPAREGVVAADPRVIPLGSEILLLGAGKYSGRYEVRDTGAKIRGRRIDIYVSDWREALEFGARLVEVHVLRAPESGPPPLLFRRSVPRVLVVCRHDSASAFVASSDPFGGRSGICRLLTGPNQRAFAPQLRPHHRR